MTFPRPLVELLSKLVVCLALGTMAARGASPEEPLWAYGFVTPGSPGERAPVPTHVTAARTLRPGEDAGEQLRKRHIDGSAAAFSLLEIRNGNEVADWFPGEHPPLTPIMKHGPARLGQNALGCAFCHMPNGRGRPENAPVAGLPEAYFIRQMEDMRHGLRTSAEPRKANTLNMIFLAQAMTDAEIRETAKYFAGLTWTPWIRVVETDRVPRTRISTNMFLPIEKEPTELLGARIIEVPEDVEATELLRDPHRGFIAYVPFGSVRKGHDLVTTGGGALVDGKPASCVTCHGPDLNGVGEVPGIAGRSPSYIARQLYDIQQGTRKGALAELMRPVVAHLTNDDFVAIAAYVSSLPPGK
jgi:cytochrome c553